MKSVRKSTIVFVSVIMLSLMMSIIFLGNRVEAKALENGSVSVEYKSIDKYYGKEAPMYEEGYVFAGWYEDEECNTSYVQKEGETLERYYAKFVPEAVLSVKAQNEKALWDTVLEDSSTGQIRFVTSVDSLNYKEVGLHIGQFGNTTLNKDYSIGKVYTYLYATGTTDKEAEPKTAAAVFGTEASEFFVAQNFKINLGQFDDDFTVTPYWITPDGVKVEGTERTRNMIENLEEGSYAEVNKRAYYTSDDIFQIATAMNQEGTKEKIWVGEEPATMTVLKDVVISGQTSFAGTTTITNKAGKSVTIQTAEKWSENSIGACLLFTNGNTLIVAGASPEAGITIDGCRLKTQIRNNSTFEASNVTFINGYRADSYGGAINADGGTSTTISQCAFNNNEANKDGGAIYVKNGNLQIIDSEFSGNKATTGHGGAIFAGDNAKVTLTVSSEQATLKNFINNKALANSGGAIMVNGANAEASVTGYTFTENNAKSMGGAIRFCDGVVFNVESCKFTSNIANAASTAAGGAIYAQKDATVKDCTFTSNSAPNFSGGAIDARGVLTVDNSTFTGNNTKTNGGAVYVTTGSLNLSNSTLKGNYTTNSHGGAVAVMSARESNLSNTKFYSNETRGSGAGGGALHVTGATCNVRGCEFGKENAPNTAKTYGGAIYVTGSTGILNLTIDENVDSSRNCFDYNEALTGGGAIAVRGNGKANINGCSFTSNKATTDTGDMINGGGAIWAEGTQTTVASSTFTQNKGRDGGAIHVRSTSNEVTVTNCTFIQNNSTHRGAAVCVQNNAKGIAIVNSKFNENETKGHGGAIFARAGLNVRNCEFYSNEASGNYGGAIDQELGQGTVETSVFYSNSATTGGAVASTGGTLTLTNCDFNKTIDGSVKGNTASNGGVAGATGSGQIIIKIEDGTSRSLTGNTTTKGNLYAQNGASIQYSPLYTEVEPVTGGSPVGTVTKITQ